MKTKEQKETRNIIKNNTRICYSLSKKHAEEFDARFKNANMKVKELYSSNSIPILVGLHGMLQLALVAFSQWEEGISYEDAMVSIEEGTLLPAKGSNRLLDEYAKILQAESEDIKAFFEEHGTLEELDG